MYQVRTVLDSTCLLIAIDSSIPCRSSGLSTGKGCVHLRNPSRLILVPTTLPLELLGARPSNSRKITQPAGRMTYENRPLTASSQHALDYVTSALRRILTSDHRASLSGVRLVTRLSQ